MTIPQIDPDEELATVDLEAVTRAIEICRAADPVRRQQLDDMLTSGRPFEEVGIFAASVAQSESLGLLPWQTVPMYAEVTADFNEPDDARRTRDASLLLRRMLAAGLSRYEPDPIGALERCAARSEALQRKVINGALNARALRR